MVNKKTGKSDVWELFGRNIHRYELMKGFVACKACKKAYFLKGNAHATRKHCGCDIGESGPATKTAGSESVMPSFTSVQFVMTILLPISCNLDLNVGCVVRSEAVFAVRTSV